MQNKDNYYVKYLEISYLNELVLFLKEISLN